MVKSFANKPTGSVLTPSLKQNGNGLQQSKSRQIRHASQDQFPRTSLSKNNSNIIKRVSSGRCNVGVDSKTNNSFGEVQQLNLIGRYTPNGQQQHQPMTQLFYNHQNVPHQANSKLFVS